MLITALNHTGAKTTFNYVFIPPEFTGDLNAFSHFYGNATYGVWWSCQVIEMVSIFCFVFLILGGFLNQGPAFVPDLYPLQYYGIVQRFLLFTFYLYIACPGIFLKACRSNPELRKHSA